MKILLVLHLLFVSFSWAKLAPTTFTGFLKETELIIYGTPMKVEWGDFERGSASFRVNKILRGEFKEPMLTISWDDEVHDQRIDNMGVDWILFLKKDPKTNKYTGSHYGRSYWPLSTRAMSAEKANLDWDGNGVYYDYPISMITFNKDQKKKLFSKKKNFYDKNLDFIKAKSLVNFLNESK